MAPRSVTAEALTNLLESLPEAILSVEGRCVEFVNRKAADLTGWETVPQGEDVTAWVVEEDRPTLLAALKGDTATGWDTDLCFLSEEGVEKPLTARFTPKDTGTGWLIALRRPYHAGTDDIDPLVEPAQTAAEKAHTLERDALLLAREREIAFRRQLLEATREGYWFVDADGTTMGINPAMCQILGRSAKEVIGRPIFDFVDDINAERFRSELATRKTGEAASYELSLTRPDGSRADCVNNATPIFDETGSLIGSVGLWTDISELKRVELEALAQAERLKDFSEIASDWFWEMDENLCFSYFSDRFTEITGVPTDHLLGKTREETGIPGLPDEEWENHLENLANHRAFTNFIHYRIKGDGAKVWLAISGKPIFAPDGTFIGYRGVGRDITKHYTLQNQLLDSIAAMPDAFAYYDRDDRLVFWNEKYRMTYPSLAEHVKRGVCFEDLIRRSIASGELDNGGLTTDQVVANRMALHRNPGAPFEQRFADGRIIQVIEYRTQDGGIVGVRRDITDARMAEHRLRQSSAELEAMNRELERHRDQLEELVSQRTLELSVALINEKTSAQVQRDFVSMVSHEFRTPLAIIDSTAQRIDRKWRQMEEADFDARIRTIRGAIHRVTDLMESVLDSGKIDSGKIEIELEELDLAKVLSEVIARQRDISPKYELAIKIEGELGIRADRIAMDHVFSNLLSNAVKYSPDTQLIEIFARAAEEEIIIKIKDYGLGIPKAELPNTFQRYFRASTSSGIAGTGLGLYLVKQLVDLHNGDISVESDTGKGSLFTVHLPVDPQQASQRRKDRRRTVSAAVEALFPEELDRRKQRSAGD